MNRNPIWFNIIAIIVIVIALISLVSNAPFLRILNTLGLVVLMVSLGTFAWIKNKARAYTFFRYQCIFSFCSGFSVSDFIRKFPELPFC